MCERKALHKHIGKMYPGVNFINILCADIILPKIIKSKCYREKLRKALLYRKCESKILMKHTPGLNNIIMSFSHGDAGILFSKDKPYPTEEIWKKFEICRTLIGKPKLFFIQACQGTRYDHGTELREGKICFFISHCLINKITYN